ncbi:class I SAM-dependent methyltransferase [Corynebacterium pacaense]|uniref:class I SAM-dependent methyltransferase n=1 Tax=Corynebacterium pacaense TaxID=1816684 RepID=UPI0009BC4C81|nr:class I SAM-dependent methyltransferase [Corynebacterium pacaense]
MTYPPIPPVSRRDAPLFATPEHRGLGASAFTSGGGRYHDVRPGYPAQVLDLIPAGSRVLDVGAGTGKLTGQMHARGHDVCALDPSPDMLKVLRVAVPKVPCWRATAEATAVRGGVFDLITCAQTWHWVDVVGASSEFARVAPTVLLVWNNLDTRDPWVHRLSRIMHAGDVLKPGFLPHIGAPWAVSSTLRCDWSQTMTTQQIIELAHTRSYWLRAGETVRTRVDANLDWYLHEHLGFAPGEQIALPYRCDAFLLRR